MPREKIISAPLQRALDRLFVAIGTKGYSATISKSEDFDLGLQCDITDQDGEVFSAAGEDYAEVIDTVLLSADARRARKAFLHDWIDRA
jgi:hypothetical protein